MKKEKIIEQPLDEQPVEQPAEQVAAPEVKEPAPKAQKITKVGTMLKEVRQQKGLKLNDIAKKLCVRKLYLDAIEESNYKELPPFPYGIGFIRSYASFLGLNGENIVELYKEETHTAEPKDMHVLEPQPEASLPGIQYLIISLIAIAVIYVGWIAFSQDEEASLPQQETAVEETTSSNNGMIIVEEFNTEEMPEETQILPENITESVPVDEGPAADIQPQETPVPAVVEPIKETKEEPTAEATAKPAIPDKGVFVEVLTETWVEVKDGTKLYLSKVLQPGSTYKVPEGKGMILSLGKYDGANVYINGKLTKVARPGKKTNIALDPFLNDAL